MTPLVAHLQGRVDNFEAMAKLYAAQAMNDHIDPIERRAYADIARLLERVVTRFNAAMVEADEQLRLELELVA